MTSKLTIPEVFAQLAAEGLTPLLEGETGLGESEAQAVGSNLPWYVKFFVGLAAWIAALLITAFFFIIGIIDDDGALFFGLIFCVGAIGLNRAAGSSVFLGQLSLATSLTGQIMAIVGLYAQFDFDQITPIVIFVVVLESFLIWLHHDAVLRFLSTLVIVSFLLTWIFDQETFNAIHVLVFLLGAGVLFLHLFDAAIKARRINDVLTPVGSGITVSMLGILIMPLMDEYELLWQIDAAIFFILFIFLMSKIILSLGYPLQNKVFLALVAGCTLLLIPSLRMPGILAALLVLVLGFWRNSRGTMGLASVFLIFYVWAYYYSLEWTLLAKSLVLLGSGLLLLALRYLVLTLTKNGEAA